jgi:hypothetical protein
MKNKILVGLGTAVAFLGMAGRAFALPPVADPDVVTGVTDIATGTQTSGVSMLTTILPIAGVLLISVIVITFGIRAFRKVAHV